MNIRDDTGLVSDEELRRGPRRPWLGPHRPIDAVSSPVALGVVAGLVVGKPLGVVGAAWLAIRLRAASLPSEINWRQLSGVGAVAGIGFTMSLFIAGLAFSGDAAAFEQAKLGIFAASPVAAGIGALILRRASGRDRG